MTKGLKRKMKLLIIDYLSILGNMSNLFKLKNLNRLVIFYG